MNMTRSVLAMLCVALATLAGHATAQAAEYDQLVADWMAVNRDYRAALKELQATEQYQAASKARDSVKLRELSSKLTRPDGKAFGERALQLAAAAGDAGAMPFYVYAAANFNDKATVVAIVERVRERHIQSASIVPLLENAMALSRYLGPQEAGAFLDQVIEANESKVARAWAMYWQATTLQRGRNVTDEAKEQAAALMAEAEKLAVGTELADRIAAPRFEEQNLQVGMVAPDILGDDIEGVAFRLADYRGKVVLLDFWGFW